MDRLFHAYRHAIECIRKSSTAAQFSLDQLRYQYPVDYEGGETPMQKLERLTWKRGEEALRRRRLDTVTATILA